MAGPRLLLIGTQATRVEPDLAWFTEDTSVAADVLKRCCLARRRQIWPSAISMACATAEIRTDLEIRSNRVISPLRSVWRRLVSASIH